MYFDRTRTHILNYYLKFFYIVVFNMWNMFTEIELYYFIQFDVILALSRVFFYKKKK